MIITWLGQACFKIKSKDLTLISDPFGPETGLKPVKSKADIVTISHNHPDHSYLGGIWGHPFLIQAPGEYEIKGIYIVGFPSWHDAKEGKERGGNIIYRYLIEDIVFVHLGDIGHLLPEEVLDSLGNVDVLFLPVGDVYTLPIDKTPELVSQIEPRLVIPMHYKIPHLIYPLEPVNKFCEEMGISPQDQLDKLHLKKKDLISEKTEIKILKSINNV